MFGLNISQLDITDGSILIHVKMPMMNRYFTHEIGGRRWHIALRLMNSAPWMLRDGMFGVHTRKGSLETV